MASATPSTHLLPMVLLVLGHQPLMGALVSGPQLPTALPLTMTLPVLTAPTR